MTNVKILIIQTAFIGDVVLATPLVEKLNVHFPFSKIDILVRKGNESLFNEHPFLNEVLVFDKKKNKFLNFWKLLKKIRRKRYDYVINVQRFFTTGLLTALSGAVETIGFKKNPLSIFFDYRVEHFISKDKTTHEVERNLKLIEDITDVSFENPVLYPTKADIESFSGTKPYICIAPASVWFTKQFPPHKWVELLNNLPAKYTIYLLGAKTDIALCEEIKSKTKNQKVEILAGKISMTASMAVMQKAEMNYVNDSAPLHFASAVNAPVTAIFCSTVPQFGFTPLSEKSFVIEKNPAPACRPCGLHGYRKCPKKHFQCADIDVTEIIKLTLS